MKIHLIRHGKTIANENHLYCGATDICLSQKGIQEIEFYKSQNIYPKVEFCGTSSLIRTIETAKIVFGNIEPLKICEFNEINFGDFEMKTYEDLKHNSQYINWITNIENLAPPNGEAKACFETRIMNAFETFVENMNNQNAKNVGLVVHGGVIATIMKKLFRSEKNFYQWQPPCAKGYSLYLQNGQIINYYNI